MKGYDILICGIGGQGAISMGTVLKLAAIRQGISVVGAERRGGAQREGPVTSNVRYRTGDAGDERSTAASGLIPAAGADLMISMEPLETLRHSRHLHGDSVVIVNDFPLIPVAVRMGDAKYPPLEEIYARLREFTPHVHVFNIDGLSLEHFGSPRQVNIIALGLASALAKLPISPEAILETVREQFPGFETNRRAFELGGRIAREYLSSGGR